MCIWSSLKNHPKGMLGGPISFTIGVKLSEVCCTDANGRCSWSSLWVIFSFGFCEEINVVKKCGKFREKHARKQLSSELDSSLLWNVNGHSSFIHTVELYDLYCLGTNVIGLLGNRFLCWFGSRFGRDAFFLSSFAYFSSFLDEPIIVLVSCKVRYAHSKKFPYHLRSL